MTRYTPNYIQAGTYAAVNDRRLVGAIWPNAAVSGMVATTPGGMTVNLAQGAAVVKIGTYVAALCSSNAQEVVTIGAAPASNSRIDLVVVQVRATELDSGSNNDWIMAVVPGTVAASPVPPAVPTYATALAQVLVAAGTVNLTAGMITDVRPNPLDVAANEPWGAIVKPATTNVNQTGITTPFVDITNLAVTYPQTANRRYELTAWLPSVQQLSAAGNITIQIVDEANTVRTSAVAIGMPAGQGLPWHLYFTYDPTVTQARTMRVRAQTSAGSLTINCATTLGFLAVKDLGPAPGIGGTLFDALVGRVDVDISTLPNLEKIRNEENMTPTEPTPEPTEPEPEPTTPEPEPQPGE